MAYNYEKEDYMKKAEAEKEELGKKIIDMAENFRDNPDDLAELFRFNASFYQYSPKNTLLIYQQNPNAHYTGSYKHFQEKGYQVKKGEKGMKIFVPVMLKIYEDEKGDMFTYSNATKEQKEAIKKGTVKTRETMKFKLGTVFDIAQTNCPVEEYPNVYNKGYQSEEHKAIYEALKEYSNAVLGYRVYEKDLGSITLSGQCAVVGKYIDINTNLQDTNKVSTLTHEIGHAVMHGLAEIKSMHSSLIEFEADCLSIMIQERLGLEISDSRKRHLSNHYKKYLEYAEANKDSENIISIEQTIGRVSNVFGECMEDITRYISSFIDKEASQEKKEELQEELETPYVKIIYSEHGHELLQNGSILTLKAAEELFKDIDFDICLENSKTGDERYYKTKFEIILDSEGTAYIGRQDFGDGAGGLIHHISQFWETEYKYQLETHQLSQGEYDDKVSTVRCLVKDLYNEVDLQRANEYEKKSELAKENGHLELQGLYLEEAIGHRQLIQERNKHFEVHGYAGEYDFMNPYQKKDNDIKRYGNRSKVNMMEAKKKDELEK